MAIIISPLYTTRAPNLSLIPCKKPTRRILIIISCRSSSQPMDPSSSSNGGEKSNKFIDFPYVAPPYRSLMTDLVTTVETRLHDYLLPLKNQEKDVPKATGFNNNNNNNNNYNYYRNESNTAHANIYIRNGIKPSPIDFVLGSWLHCQLPTGGALNIVSLATYLSSSTDAPNFFVDLIQSSPTSLVLILDMPPRRELVLHPDYLKTFYEDTELDKQRQSLLKVPEVKPYSSPSLYIRSLISPTAILIRIDTGDGGKERMEEIVRDDVSVVAKEVLGVWLDKCARGDRSVGESEREYLVKRDSVVKKMSLEIDLGTSLPRMFGQEVADKMLGVIKEAYNV